MQDITNTFSQYLVYSIKDENNQVIAQETRVPSTTSKAYLKTNVPISANKTKTYTLTIEYQLIDGLTIN